MANCSQKNKGSLCDTYLTYIDYQKNSDCMKSYKIPQLKTLAKHHKLHVSGTKPVLLTRIDTFFKESLCTLKIQRILRGFLVRFSNTLRGKGFYNRSLCVNDTDFYTLEPLINIEYDDFYSYMDEKQFVYGFSITSLLMLQKQKMAIVNPYNREPFTEKNRDQLRTLCKLNTILYNKQTDATISQKKNIHQTIIPNRIPNNENHFIEMRFFHHQNIINRELIIRMTEIQTKPIERRIQELFMEIDHLGNYTQSNWFHLSTNNYIRFYRCLYDIWTHRAQLSRETKSNICSLCDPFQRTGRINEVHPSLEQIALRCLFVMEHMVYTGVDIEYRRLGALHVLSALTVVSLNARNAMGWLYESLVI